MTETPSSASSAAGATSSLDPDTNGTIIMLEEADNSNMTPAMKDLLAVAHSSIEVLVGLLQILMAECGLYLVSESDEKNPYEGENIGRKEQFFDVRIMKKLKLDISKNSDGVYTNEFLLSGFPKLPVKLLCVPQNNNVLISAIIPALKLIYSAVLKTQHYIIETSKNSFMILNMKSLSIKFKNAIALPVRASILNKLGVPNPSLEGLPDEVLNIIWKKIPQPEFLLPATPQASAIFTSK